MDDVITRRDWRRFPAYVSHLPKTVGVFIGQELGGRQPDMTRARIVGLPADFLCRTTWPGHEPDLIGDLVERVERLSLGPTKEEQARRRLECK